MPPEDSKNALIDLDGSMCDFRGALDRELARVLNGRGEDVKVPACVVQEVEYLIRGQDGFYRNLQPLPLGFKLLDVLKEIGFKLMVMTKASMVSKNAWTEKVEWVVQHLSRYDVDMTVTMNKTLVYGRVLFDDYPGHFMGWLKRRPRGIVVMTSQPWNLDCPSHPRLHRIRTEADVEALRPILQASFDREGGA